MMETVMLASSVTILEILVVKMCMTLTLRWAKVKSKYANGKIVCNFLFVGNDNVFPICHRLQDFHSRNVHDFDLDL